MSKIQCSHNKTMKLQNVLCQRLNLEDDELDFTIQVEKMQSYIKVKGVTQIGPLIQHPNPFENEKGEWDIEITLFMQCNSYIHNVEKPYSIKSIFRISNCMYCRFIGPEKLMKFAYDKINLEAFENDIELTGESYTVFVDQNEEEGTIVADVFMPKAKDE